MNKLVAMVVSMIIIFTIVVFSANIEDNRKDIQKNIPENVYKSISKYLDDNDVYSYSISDYNYKIEIQKYLSKIKPETKEEKANLKDVYFYATYIKKKPLVDLLDYKVSNDEKRLIFKDKNINIYDVMVRETEKNGILRLMLLTDNKDNIIWDILHYTPPILGVPTRILDIKKVNDDSYIVACLPEMGIMVDYVHLDNKIPVIERYAMPFDSFGSGYIAIPISARILKDDIIRLEYKDGAIEHWKIKQTKTDFDKNRESKEMGNIHYGDDALVWWNGVGKGSPLNHVKAKAWDYDEDTSTEPTYE